MPSGAVEIAVRAASLIGDGLYGVDVKEVNGGFLVMEVNDNPNIDAGYEDAVLGDRLYLAVMEWFRQRARRARTRAGVPWRVTGGPSASSRATGSSSST